ncbi:hypothetical protein P278_04420 [Zhouia amylolytica AD3]|uniref:Uncharacterized protein n=1 Tax=Zhouia amylolytica AD3 TaxID=1286632 RepID=W2US63_9FLAO|nr:hypothetical protein P278_04420 [Zhouia amylolytica AD3]
MNAIVVIDSTESSNLDLIIRLFRLIINNRANVKTNLNLTKFI